MRQLQKHPLYGHTFPNEVRLPPLALLAPLPARSRTINCVLGIRGRINFLNFLDALRADAPSPHLAPQVFTLGRAAGPAVMSARAPPSTPLEAVKRGVDDFGAALQRFDRRVKEALRKIPGSKMPGAARGPAPAEGPAAWKKKKPPAGAPNAKAARPGAPPAEKKKPADDSRVKAYIRHSYANKPAHTGNPPDSSSAATGGPAPMPTNVNSAAPSGPSGPGGSAGVRGSPQRRPPGPTVKMAAKKAQRVTLADLSEADASVVARARAALAGVDWADARTRTVAGVGACLALFASLRAVSAARRRGRDGGEGNGRDSNLDTADIDSAYASPQLTPRAGPAPGGKKARRADEDENPASAAPSAASSARRLFFGLAEASRATGSDEGKDSSAAREKPPSVPEEAASVPTKSSSTRSRLGGAFGGGFPVGKRASIRHRLGFGSDAFARAVHAKTAVIKATRRLKRAGDLRVSVIDVELIDGFAAEVERARDARLAEAEAAAAAGAARGETDARGSRLASSNARRTKNSTRFAMKFRVDVDVPAGHPARSACTAPERLNRRKDLVGFNSRMAFALPADGSGHEGREIKVRLCDASGRCVAKAGLGLRATLRAAPVTKAFPIFDRGGEKVGTARLAFEWAYEKKA